MRPFPVNRRRALGVLAALPWAAAPAGAQTPGSGEGGAFPRHAVRFVVPYAPGGTSDVLARLIGQKLAVRWGQQAIVDNRPGAGTVIGANAVRQATDGHTFLVANNTHVISPLLMPSLPYDPLGDFTPVCTLATSDYLLLAAPRLGVRSLAEFIELARKRPGQLNFGTHGVGGLTHVAAELLNAMAGIRMALVQYKGAGPALTAMLAGEVDVYFDAPATTLSYVKEGRLVPIGISGTRRLAALPQVPTIAEAGVPGYDVTIWYGLMGPAGLPQRHADRLQEDVQAVLREPEVGERLEALGVAARFMPQREFGPFAAREQERYRRLIAERGIKA